ncbi:type I phosphomannose isomerase catalytic subunit [Prevotella sp. OH937_COT-195]|uniref:type I phosphomannose isomerase catalytic subunit n=1 Tax=Prevotella sp. OH937_COT-195 TaxID=2491051 RepID=UPI000F6480E1|nr:type I phosphomannose isomerase catalytic subunit [Prevotella sp. OH937_COT-195]RRD00336.1 mannose-6-phosphate isomerase [Prevotella sp. OH937_COT-195]
MQILRFEPLLKQTIWGGDKIIPFKKNNSDMQCVGESWEISGVKGSETVVCDGTMKGRKLNDLVAEMKDKLVGKENYERFGNEFPLLIKFIHARKDLSIQVHPTDEVARRHGYPRGKTEMWYMLDSEPGARIYCGLKRRITREEYCEMVAGDTICDALAEYDVSEDDVFFLPSGRIHAIRSGCFLAEIQQTSDVTYRIYDYKRKDRDGNYRQLHTQKAAESIDYTVEDDYRTHYVPRKNMGVTLVECPHFRTSVYDLDEPMTLDYSDLDSFVILIALKGNGQVTDEDGNTLTFCAGETLLLPATMTQVSVEGTVKFLETYV